MIILLGRGLRQCRPREMEPQPAQRLRLVAVFDAREAGDDDALCSTYEAQFEAAVAGLIHQRPVMRDVLGFFGEALDPHRALDAVRSGDDAEANLLRLPLTPALFPPAGRGRGFAFSGRHGTAA